MSDPKFKLKSKIALYLNNKINAYELNNNKTKIKSGRKYSLTVSECIDAVLYVLIEGVTWNIASKITTGTYKYRSTLNRRFNKWVSVGIFKDTYDEILKNYLTENDIDEIYIDSTDIQNKNLSKNNTFKSFKLKKEALRLTVIGDNNKAPLDYSICKAQKSDSSLGYDLLMNTRLKVKRKTKVYGDKGYYIKETKRKAIMVRNKIQLVVPKKRYKKRINKKRSNKRKIIRHSQQMKNGLKRRVRIEHLNSDLHRQYKRIDKIFEKKIATFDAFIKLAMSVMLINKI